MNDRQLTSFIKAAECGSFNKAASQSFITVQSFIQQINLLEQELGFKLFVRKHSGIALTEPGKAFLKAAQSIIELYETAKNAGKACEEASRKRIFVGCPTEDVSPFMVRLSEFFAELHPDFELEYAISSYKSLISDVATGHSDLCFFPKTRSLDKFGLHFTKLYTDEYVCCVSPHSDLAQKEKLTVEDFIGNTIYIERQYRDVESMAALIDAIRDRGFDIIISDESYSGALIMEIVQKGGILPNPSRYAQALAPTLAIVPFDWNPSDFGIVYRDSSRLEEFIAAAISYFQSE